MGAATLLTLVEGLNTGVLLLKSVGPLIQQMLENGATASTPVTQQMLENASIELGHDLDDLAAAIEAKKKRDAANDNDGIQRR